MSLMEMIRSVSSTIVAGFSRAAMRLKIDEPAEAEPDAESDAESERVEDMPLS
jgi:hypothetical protein